MYGVKSLYLAWDFTVGSEQNLAGGMLHMRDDAMHNSVPACRPST